MLNVSDGVLTLHISDGVLTFNVSDGVPDSVQLLTSTESDECISVSSTFKLVFLTSDRCCWLSTLLGAVVVALALVGITCPSASVGLLHVLLSGSNSGLR